MARTFYYLNNEQVENWQRKLAETEYKKLRFKEPPLFEYIVAKTYLLTDGEQIWVPRLFSTLFWLLGGVLLYRLLIHFIAPGAAILSLAYYLFLPFGFFISRSFQAESMMIMFFIASILTIYRYFEKPSTRRLILAAFVSSVAIVIKFIPLFSISTAFIFLSFSKNNKNKLLFIKESFVFLLIAVLPSLVYYSYISMNAGPLRSAANSIFLPHLLISSFFWKGWLHIFGITIGLIAVAWSIAGIIMLKNKIAKTLLAGLWIGYLVYGLIFSYTSATHDYYQVTTVPIAALSIAPVCQYIIKAFTKLSQKWQLLLAFIAIIIPLLTLNYLKDNKHDQFFEINENLKNKLEFVCDIVGINPHKLKKINRDYNDEIEMFRHIGNTINHSTNTIILDKNYAHPVMYFGEIIGKNWPSTGQLNYLKNIAEIETPSVQTRFDNILKKASPEYFIVTDVESFKSQSELKHLLDTNYDILDKTEDFVIYDLRKPVKTQ